MRRANTSIDRGDTEAGALVDAVREMTDAVGLELTWSAVVPDEVRAQAAALDAARAEKDFARADAIRAELHAGGWIVETTPAGTVIRR